MPSKVIYICDNEPYYIGWLSNRITVVKVKKITWSGTIESVVLGIKAHSPNYWMITPVYMNGKAILHPEVPSKLEGNGCETKSGSYSQTAGGLTNQPTSEPIKTILVNGDNKFEITLKNTNSWFRGQDYTLTVWLDITYTGEIHFDPTTAWGTAEGGLDIPSLMNMMMAFMFMMMFMSIMTSMMTAMVESS